MTARNTRLLVIDTSVVRSAGETQHPMSSACRECLIAVLRICHHVAVTEEIRKEWKKHMSRFSRKWWRSMTVRKKAPSIPAPSRVNLDTKGLGASDLKAVEKDRCLLDAAFAADKVIVTRDESLQVALAKTSKGTQMLQLVKWINPVTDGSKALDAL